MELIKRDDVIAILDNEIYREECEFDDGDCVVCWVVDDKDDVIASIKRLPTYERRMELISREMAIDHMRVLGGEDRERLMRILNNKNILPTIESRPIGKWIDNPPDSWICSNCGTHYEERLTFKAHNYCCVCGAYMGGE